MAGFVAAANRHFTDSNGPQDIPDFNNELLSSLERIITHVPPVNLSNQVMQFTKPEITVTWVYHGLYSGPTSIAYLFYRLSHLYPDLHLRDYTLQQWAIAYLSIDMQPATPIIDPNHCGIATEGLARTAVSAVLLQNKVQARRVCDYRTSILRETASGGSNEWLYGKAGYLYLLRVLRSGFNAERHPNTYAMISTAIQQTLEAILRMPLPWKWHGKEYIGAAHGTIGIITQVVLSDVSTALQLEELLDDTLNQQFQSGNFPSSLPSMSNRLVQFCHGAPGFIISLDSIKTYFPSLRDKIEECIRKARTVVLARGLLTKEPCLCHGIAGNVLSLSDDDDDDKGEQRLRFLSHMTSSSLRIRGWCPEEHPTCDSFSLYTGEAGRAWCWAVMDQKLPGSCIGYNDL